MKGKKLIHILTSLCLSTAILASCGQSESSVPEKESSESISENGETSAGENEEGQNQAEGIDWDEDPAEVNWYMWAAGVSAPGQDAIDRIEEKVNEITLKEINVHVNLSILEMGTYLTQMPMQITAGDKIDLITTFPAGSGTFSNMVSSGQLLPLGDYLDSCCGDMLEVVPDNFFDATTVKGEIYAAPIYTDYTNDLYFIGKKDIFEETGFNAEDVDSYEELEKVFEKVKELHPELKIVSSGAQTITGSVGVTLNNEKYDTLTDIAVVFYEKEGQETKVVNLYETDEYKREVGIYRDWYEKGYVDQDIMMREDDPTDDPTVFGGFLQGNKARTQNKVSPQGTELVSLKMAEGPVVTSSVAIMTMAIPVNATEPEAAARVMNLAYTNADLKNLVSYGIEGEDYTLNEDNGVVITENCTYAPNTNTIFGNVFLGHLTEGEALAGVTRDIPDQSTLAYSPFLGFTVDLEPISNEVAQLSSIIEEYGKQVRCGMADEDTYQEMIDKMYASGLETYLTEIQRQLDEWLENQ
ncbi:extracellular solute-binding protein [Catenibacillus scindens]|uniref:ABC transporter substrate-binding protein n=1 Tax=Catenibacillus scindens TaxID=673271 RepID=UPI003208E81A